MSTQGLVSFQDRKQPEHVYGRVVNRNATLDEAIAEVGLDSFHERVVPVVGLDTDGTAIEIPGKGGIAGTVNGKNHVWGIHSDRYGEVWHRDALKHVETLVSESDLRVDAMGYYKDGAVAFASLVMPESVKIAGIDPVTTYLRVVSSYDGSTPLLYQAHAVRQMCANEIPGMLRNRKLPRITVKHIGDPLSRVGIATAREALGLTFSAHDEFVAIAEQWANESYVAAQVDEVLGRLYPIAEGDSQRAITRAENSQELVMDTLNSETNDNIRGSWWGLFNAATEVAQWKQPDKDEHRRAASVLNGGLDKNVGRIQSIISDVSGLALV